MSDVVDQSTRSRMMSGIRGKDTKPELIIRRALHQKGFRYRLHSKEIPGKPDIVLKKFSAIIFINGCFWHGHNCHLFKWPSSRTEFWKQKIGQTQLRDIRNREAAISLGWRVLTVWECCVKGKTRFPESQLVEEITEWLSGDSTCHEISAPNITNT